MAVYCVCEYGDEQFVFESIAAEKFSEPRNIILETDFQSKKCNFCPEKKAKFKMVYRPSQIRTNFQMGEMPVENIIYSR